MECLIHVYLRYRKSEHSSTGVDASDPGTYIVRGHLSILFGLLMRGSPENERIILDSLPGPSRGAKVDDLVSYANEFVGLYREFMKRVAREGGRGSSEVDDEDAPEETRLELGKARDGAGEDVAREIVSYLEGLRNF